jgi:hypothetical protein
MRGVIRFIFPFVFIIFFSGYSFSQTFRLGFDFEVSQVHVIDQYGRRGNLGVQSLPVAVHLAFGYSPVDNLTLNAKIGNIFTWAEFNGMEYGINARYNFFHLLFLTGGFLVHLNEGGTGSISWGSHFATIPMVQLGTGIMVGTSFSLTVDYYIATSKKLIDSYRIDSYYSTETYDYSNKKFESMIRFGFALGWNL